MPNWEKHQTLKELFDLHKKGERLKIVWPTSKVKIQLETMEDHFPSRGEDADECSLPEAPTEVAVPVPVPVPVPEDQAPVEAAAQECPLEDPVIPEEEEDQSYLPSTREYGDRFHIFDAMPSSKDPTLKCCFALIRRLVIQATCEFDHDDWNAITAHLAQRSRVRSMEAILDHFHFNREWWRRRVRVHPLAAEHGVKNYQAEPDSVDKISLLKQACTLNPVSNAAT